MGKPTPAPVDRETIPDPRQTDLEDAARRAKEQPPKPQRSKSWDVV